MLIAKNLRKNGFKKGDVIGLVSENRLEFITITLGCIYAGAIIAPVNATYKESEFSITLSSWRWIIENFQYSSGT